MKNRLLAVIRETIPYVKELRPIAGSVAACIVMQQLDYWFDRFPDGFYKFLEPCNHSGYKDGDSWTEELAVSPDEFRTAFDKIGTRHTSKTAFLSADDKFKGKFYCSYYDKKDGVTWYYRDHERTDNAIDEIIRTAQKKAQQRPSPVDGKIHLQEMEPPISIAGKPHLQKPELPISISTETTSESTTENTQQQAADESLTSSDEIDAIAESLTKLRMSVSEARRRAKESPQLARECIEYFARIDKSKLNSLLASVRSFFKDPETWRAKAPEPQRRNGHSKSPEQLAADHGQRLEAAQMVYDELPWNDRRLIDIEATEKNESAAVVTLRRKVSEVNLKTRVAK